MEDKVRAIVDFQRIGHVPYTDTIVSLCVTSISLWPNFIKFVDSTVRLRTPASDKSNRIPYISCGMSGSGPSTCCHPSACVGVQYGKTAPSHAWRLSARSSAYDLVDRSKEGMHWLLSIGIGTAKCEICTCDFDIGLNYCCLCTIIIIIIHHHKKRRKKDMQLKTRCT